MKRKTAQAGGRPITNYRIAKCDGKRGRNGLVHSKKKKIKIMNYEKATNQWEKKCKEDHFAVRKDSVDF